MIDLKNFYPTPDKLIQKMWSKVNNKREITTILEPSAGKGNIVDYISDTERYYGYKVSCIEIEENLKYILQGKGHKVIDSDFLDYSGLDCFDLIIGNPPFDNGDKHLLKAIDILHSGQIVFLLNAETIKNPYTVTRELLVRKLEELNADIEYIDNAFVDAERKTNVSVALIHIEKKDGFEDDLFSDSTDKAEGIHIELEDEKNEIASRNSVEFLVQKYNSVINSGLEVFKDFYSKDTEFLYIEVAGNDEDSRYIDCDSKNYTKRTIDDKVNRFIQTVRKSYWKEILKLKEVKSRMTSERIVEFNSAIEKQCDMDFTEKNIRAFIINLMGSYEDTLKKAVSKLFDTLTYEHHWHDETSKNKYLFNGWKTNKAFYVNSKVIIPKWNTAFRSDYSDKWNIDYRVENELNDIDIVMNYFSPDNNYISIAEALKESFLENETRNVLSTYFKISVYKKGTIHLTFRSEDVRRRFNIVACKDKNWLPEDYGNKNYNTMNDEEKDVVESFEGKEKYNKNLNQIGFSKKQETILIAI